MKARLAYAILVLLGYLSKILGREHPLKANTGSKFYAKENFISKLRNLYSDFGLKTFEFLDNSSDFN